MTYKLEFKRSALKEWNKLGSTLQQQLKKKLAERLKTPHVAPDRVLGSDNVYKIKLDRNQNAQEISEKKRLSQFWSEKKL